MSRKRYVWDPKATDPRDGTLGCMVEVDTTYQQAPREHYVRGDTPGYYSVVSDRWIDGAKARRDDLARTGCRPHEGREQEAKEAARNRGYMERAHDAKLNEHAERAYSQLSPTKRRHLGG